MRDTTGQREFVFASPEHKAIAVEMLRRALRMLKEGSEQFICHAVEEAFIKKMGDLYADHGAFLEVRRVIHKRLEGHYTLEEWLEAKGFAVFPKGPPERSVARKVQRTRIAWVKALIKELS